MEAGLAQKTRVACNVLVLWKFFSIESSKIYGLGLHGGEGKFQLHQENSWAKTVICAGCEGSLSWEYRVVKGYELGQPSECPITEYQVTSTEDKD